MALSFSLSCLPFFPLFISEGPYTSPLFSLLSLSYLSIKLLIYYILLDGIINLFRDW
jgi:hypothetical protein